MHYVYGFGTPATMTGYAELHLLVDILSEWPDKSPFLKRVLDMDGGCALFRLNPCSKTYLCDLCRECPVEERENLHNLLDLIREQFRHVKFEVFCLLAQFVSRHGSELFEKRWEECEVSPPLRLKYK